MPETPKVEVESSSSQKSQRSKTPIFMVGVAIIFLAVGFFVRGGMTGSVIATQSQDVVVFKAMDYIKTNLVQPGQNITVTSVAETGPFYKVTTSYQSQTIDVYVSKDGKYLIPASNFVIDMDKPVPVQANTDSSSTTPQEIPKTSKPVAELFVMAFCPYGVQAEDAMAPVVGLLGNKADIKVRFIASIGSTLDSVQSLHGPLEGSEDIRQLCVAKNYNTAAYWKYLSAVDANCYPINRNGDAAYEACWRAAAANASIDVSKVQSCVTNDGVNLLKAESAAADSYGVSGSPTLVINGVQYEGGRTPEDFKSAICNAFTTAPAECSQTLSSAGSSTPSGGCGA